MDVHHTALMSQPIFHANPFARAEIDALRIALDERRRGRANTLLLPWVPPSEALLNNPQLNPERVPTISCGWRLLPRSEPLSPERDLIAINNFSDRMVRDAAERNPTVYTTQPVPGSSFHYPWKFLDPQTQKSLWDAWNRPTQYTFITRPIDR